MYKNIPLAKKLRPKTLDEVLGQDNLTGNTGTIRKMLENDTLNSLILWGPPGTGKTTLAEIISSTSGRKFFKLSAVSSGVKEVREVIEDAKKQNQLHQHQHASMGAADHGVGNAIPTDGQKDLKHGECRVLESQAPAAAQHHIDQQDTRHQPRNHTVGDTRCHDANGYKVDDQTNAGCVYRSCVH